jgi:hypothetical protein
MQFLRLLGAEAEAHLRDGVVLDHNYLFYGSSLACRNMITAVGIESVAHHLPSLTALQSLDLSFNDVGDSGALALAIALPQSSTIHTVKLVRCKIYVIGARAFAESFVTMTNLHVCSLYIRQRIAKFAMCRFATKLLSRP